MATEAAAEFDSKLQGLVAPFAERGCLCLTTTTNLCWGRLGNYLPARE